MKRGRKQIAMEEVPYEQAKKEEDEKRAAEAEDDSDEEEEEEEQQEVQVDFEFYNPSEIDYQSVKNYCRALLANVAGNLDLAPALAQAVLDADVGSVVKCEGYTDALAVITVLPLWGDKVGAWAAPFLAAAGVAAKDAKGLGLLVNLRIANMPVVKLAPAMHRSLFGEVAKRPKSAGAFTRYLLIAPYYLESELDEGGNGDDDDDGDEGRGKKTAKAKKDALAAAPAGESGEKVFVRAEEELYVEVADVCNELVPSSLTSTGDVHSLLVPKHAQAVVVAASKVPGVLNKILMEFSG